MTPEQLIRRDALTLAIEALPVVDSAAAVVLMAEAFAEFLLNGAKPEQADR